MPAQIFDLVDDLTVSPAKRDAIEQGADFGWTVTFRAADTDGTDAADWAARMQIRRKVADLDGANDPLVDLDGGALGGIVITIATDAENGDAVQLDITIDDADTAVLPVGRWYYDVELERVADGYVRRIAKGRAQVSAEVTR